MHVLFVHGNFPAQFGHIAVRLIELEGWTCTFVSETEPGTHAGIRKIRYRPDEHGPVARYTFSRAFEDDVRHAAGIYQALQPLGDALRPDLIVGHAGLGPTLFLPELYPDVPIITYLEDYYDPARAPDRFRSEWPPGEGDRLRARAQTATTLLQLEQAAAGWTPTRFQRDLLPPVYHPKVHVIHDGIDSDFWRRPEGHDDTLGSPRVVTYVSRALEPLRGFDIFMRVAKRIYTEFPDVVFHIAGTDAEGYGDELRQIPEATFREHVLNQDDYDLARFRFLGWVRPEALVQILSMSDLHITLTVPIVLSWSMLNAMACGCVVLASDTEPVREVIRDGENGLLRDLFDVDALADAALEVLKDPHAFRDLGIEAERTISERFSLRAVLPHLIDFFGETARR